jgi:hypothetical protein
MNVPQSFAFERYPYLFFLEEMEDHQKISSGFQNAFQSKKKKKKFTTNPTKVFINQMEVQYTGVIRR